jgi:hypothetical protein
MAPARALDDLRDLAQVLRSRHSLAAMGAQLPPAIVEFDGDQVDTTLALVRSAADTADQIILYASVLIMKRLERRWQLLRLATRGAQTRSPRSLAASPYHPALTLVLADIEQMVAAHRAELTEGNVAAALDLLAATHRAMQAVADEIDLTEDSPASRRYAAIRLAASQSPASPATDADADRRPAIEPPEPLDLTDAAK